MEKRILKIIDNRRVELLAVSLILLGCFAVRLYKINNPIADWHSWRQVDTAAVTNIYLDEGLDLLHPRYYDISSVQTGFDNPEGLRFVEFPVFNLFHYFFVKAFPFISFDALGRSVSILSAVVTTFFLFKIGKKLMGKWVGLSAAFFYAFIPFNVYFTRVILPDPLTVTLSISSLWFFLVYYESNKKFPIFVSAFLFGIGMIAKPQALFFGLPIAVLMLQKHSFKKIIQSVPLVFSLFLAFMPFILWRYWITQPENIRGIAHISWVFNGDNIRFKPAFWRWIFGERIGTLILGVWGVIPFGFGLLNLKKKDLFLVCLTLGMFLYLSIIATANVRHDYYQTYIVPAIALLLGYGSIQLWNYKAFNKWGRRLTVVFSVFMIFIMGYDQIKGFYNINHPEIVTAGKAVDQLAERDAKIVAPYNGDTAFLYETKRFGWPIITTNIDDLIERGADYYVSVNNDDDTNKFKQRFEIIVENDQYIILDLHKEI